MGDPLRIGPFPFCPAPGTDRDPLPQTMGQGLSTSYDTFRRWQYTTQIHANSTGALRLIDQAQVNGSLAAAEDAARNASQSRNVLRAATQEQLLPGGRVVSNMLEGDRSWGYITNRYNAAGEANFDSWRRVAAASGRSSSSMVMFTRVSRVLGPVGIVFGAGVAANEVACAPPEQRARVAAQETGGVAGGLAAGSLGMAGGALVVGLLVSNPAGWVVLGAAVIGGGILGYFGSEGGRALGGRIFDFFSG